MAAAVPRTGKRITARPNPKALTSAKSTLLVHCIILLTRSLSPHTVILAMIVTTSITAPTGKTLTRAVVTNPVVQTAWIARAQKRVAQVTRPLFMAQALAIGVTHAMPTTLVGASLLGAIKPGVIT